MTVRPSSFIRATLLIVSFFCTGCYCWTAAHQMEPRCVAARRIVDCNVDAVKGVLPMAAAVIAQLVSGGNVDLNSLLEGLKVAGITDGLCVIASLDNIARHPMPGAKAKAVAIPKGAMKELHTKYDLVMH